MSETTWQGRHPEKDQIRAEIWASLRQHQVTYHDPVGRIPNFDGADQAAQRLAGLPIWQQAKVIKCNPDSPQRPVRLHALQSGKRLYMAVPRLTKSQCFVELDALELQQRNVPLQDAATMRGALVYGQLRRFEQMQSIDLVVVGCVAATPNGGRTGKGAGFADLELALLQQFGLIKPGTAIVTTIHSLQVVDSSRLPLQPHDWPLDWLITPDQVIETQTSYARPVGLDWEALQPEQLRTIPILRQLRQTHTSLT